MGQEQGPCPSPWGGEAVSREEEGVLMRQELLSQPVLCTVSSPAPATEALIPDIIFPVNILVVPLRNKHC